jgi:hypothetical protein
VKLLLSAFFVLDGRDLPLLLFSDVDAVSSVSSDKESIFCNAVLEDLQGTLKPRAMDPGPADVVVPLTGQQISVDAQGLP